MNAAWTWSILKLYFFCIVNEICYKLTILIQHFSQWQEEKDGEVPRVLQRYTAEKLSCFGELALM